MTKSNKKAGHESDSPKKVGKPKLIESPERFNELVEIYLLSCQDEDKPKAITLTGLILALGLSSRQSLDNYLNYPEYIDSVKRAKLLVEQEYENRLITASSAGGPIFALKNFGWLDKHPTEIDNLTAEKLKRELNVDEEEIQPATVTIGVQDASNVRTEFDANLPQATFLAMPHKYRAFVAGYGTGKSVIGAVASCIHYWEHPKVNRGYFAPTYPQIRDIYYPTIDEVAFNLGLRAEIKEGNKEVHIYNGRFYRGTTICRSFEKPSTIVGFKIGKAHIDELDVADAKKAKEAWRKIIARLRWLDPSIKNGADITTTPEGFKETHRLFVREVLEKPHLAKSYGLIQASTYDNEANLPDDYIQSLLDTYPTELIEAYLMGKFVNLATGTVYRNYDRVRNNSNEVIKDNDVLHIGMDFNVMHMAATIYVVRANGWHAVDELKDLLDTPDMVSVLKERFKGHRIIVYPDATGKNREANNAKTSDIALLQQARFTVRANSTNPAVKDRVTATNKQFEVGNLWVNAKKCPTTAQCLEQQAYDKNSEPDKKSGFDHQNDATTYPIAYTFPIKRMGITRQRISGT